MRPPTVFANASGRECERLRGLLRGPGRSMVRAVMVLLSLHGLPPAEISSLLGYDPATVRRWIDRFNAHGVAGLEDRPRSGRPRLGGRRLTGRIAALLERPWPWTVRRLHHYLGRPKVSSRTLYRRLREVAVWRRPKLIARGDPHRDAILAALRRRMALLPVGAKVFTADETHVHLLPHVRARWTLPGHRPEVLTPGRNRQVSAGCAGGDLRHLLLPTRAPLCGRLPRPAQQLLAAYPDAPALAIVCDNDQIHHARAVRDFIADHPGVHLWFSARYSPHDNPAERIWAALKTFIANTAVSWPGRKRQIHAFFRGRSPDQNLATAAPWTSPWFPTRYRQDFWKAG